MKGKWPRRLWLPRAGTGRLGRTGGRLQKRERLRGGRWEQNLDGVYEQGVAFRCWGGGAGEEEESQRKPSFVHEREAHKWCAMPC